MALDLDPLLASFPGAVPTGTPARRTDALLRIQQLRKEALDQPVGQTGGWKLVVREGSTVLTTVGKDLAIVGALIEALVYVHGFVGLRDGLRLLDGLVTKYWPTLHPGFENGTVDTEIRAAPLGFIASSQPITVAILRCPVAVAGSVKLDWLAHNAARESSSDPALWNHWQVTLAAMPLVRRNATAEILGDCLGLIDGLRKFCTERLAEHAVSWTRLEELLQSIRSALSAPAPGPGANQPSMPPVVDGTQPVAPPHPTTIDPTTMDANAMQTRQDAFRELRRIATFLRQTDPHSPISYLLDRAVRWSEMPLEQLLEDIVKQKDARSQLWEMLGLKKATADEE